MDAPNQATKGSSTGLRRDVDYDCYRRLRQAIISGGVMPNERLVEADLAARFGVGRAAVRTALARLHQEGLVVHEPRRGARVRMVSEAEAIEITEARAVLEGLAARHAAYRVTPTGIARLWRLIAEMETLITSGDLLRYSGVNAVLHAGILEISGHKTAQALLSTLRAQMVRFQFHTILVPGRATESFEEHRAVVQRIADRDGDAAEQAMRRHLGFVKLALSAATALRRERSGSPPNPEAPGGT